MPDRDNQVITYLDDQEYAQIKEWSETTGKSMSHLLREAILEYTDRDRTARVEEKVDRVLSLLENGEHTHTQIETRGASATTNQKSVPERAREIADRLYKNHESPIQDEDVTRAIEDIAGGDDRTIRKYKRQLKSRDHLYEHPSDSPIWTDDRLEWVEWAEDYINAVPGVEIYEVVEDYDIQPTEYTEIVESRL